MGATLELTKVEEAMYYLYGQDLRPKAKHILDGTRTSSRSNKDGILGSLNMATLLKNVSWTPRNMRMPISWRTSSMRMSRPLKSMRTLRPPMAARMTSSTTRRSQLEEAYTTYLDARR